MENKKYYARIIGWQLLDDSDDGYWNYDDTLFIDNNWNDLHDYKTTLMTKDEWSNLGITEKNAVFQTEEE